MASEQELLSQLEELRKKQKEMEIVNNEVRISKQKDYLIDKLRKFLGMEVSDAEIIAVYTSYNFESGYQNDAFNYYLKVEDIDTKLLLVRKLYIKYARYQDIRFEDSVDIIRDFISRIKPLNEPNGWQKYLIMDKKSLELGNGRRPAEPKVNSSERNSGDYVPIFF